MPMVFSKIDVMKILWNSICTIFFSREERKWIEKQNKAARQKRKKDEMARIRLLVGMLF